MLRQKSNYIKITLTIKSRYIILKTRIVYSRRTEEVVFVNGAIIKRKTLKTQVYKRLKDSIILGEIRPGDRLIEEKISSELQVSRSPIREAIRMLEKDGLLLVNSSGGVTVVEPTIEDFRSLYECRVEMESLAAYYAAQRRTQEELEKIHINLLDYTKLSTTKKITEVNDVNFDFHDAIVKASSNPFLISMTTQLRGVNSFYRKAILENYPKHIKDALADHEKIYLAIANQDADAARLHMRRHIKNDYTLFMNIAEKQ